MKPSQRKPRKRVRLSKFPCRIGGIRLSVEAKRWLESWCDLNKISETDVVREALDEFRKQHTNEGRSS